MNRKLGPKGQYAGVPVTKPVKELPIQAIDHYWHPDREGVEKCDPAFQAEVDIATDGAVSIVRPPMNAPLVKPHAWLIWLRKPSVTNWISPGWSMLIDWRVGPKNTPMALDIRVFSYLHSVSLAKHGSAKAYFDKCVAEMQRDKAAKEKLHTDDMHARTADYFDYTKIKNIGRGNKFALHEATSLPSRGTANWLAENRRRMIPSEVLKDEQYAKERKAG